MFVSQVLSTMENEFGSQPRGVISNPKEANGMLHPHRYNLLHDISSDANKLSSHRQNIDSVVPYLKNTLSSATRDATPQMNGLDPSSPRGKMTTAQVGSVGEFGDHHPLGIQAICMETWEEIPVSRFCDQTDISRTLMPKI